MKSFKILSPVECDKINEIADSLNWVDGKKSAEGKAKEKKENTQIDSTDPEFKAKIYPYLAQIHNLEAVKAYTFMRKIIDPRLASYRVGGKYDWHVDVPLLANDRTDLSFTIFLKPKSSYDGGEMHIKTNNREITYKGDVGDMIVYPSGLLHKVDPVISGERRVIIGWLNSHVKLEEHRMRLFEFRLEFARLSKKYGNDEVETLNQIYCQIVRDYAD